jgi:hypothetical protein
MKTRRVGDGLSLVKELKKGVHAREAGQRYRCSIAYTSAVVDLISQSRAQARPHPRRLALVPAAAEAVVACTAAATVLRVEQEPGSTAQGRRYFGGAVDHETVASVGRDQGLALGDKQNLLRPAVACAAKADPGQSVDGVYVPVEHRHTLAHLPQREEDRCWTAFGAVDRQVRGDQTRTDVSKRASYCRRSAAGV